MRRLLPFVLSQLSASAPTVRTDYVGNLVYRDGLLGRILVDGGAIAAKDSTLAAAYEFAYADHLGSVRALVQMGDSLYRKTEYGPYGEVLAERWTSQLVSSVFGLGEVIEVEEEDDAEPGGGPRSISLIQTRLDNPYRFGGKERLDAGSLDLYDFGARHFTPTLPRWLTMDPLSEKYYGVSPYVYCAGNPVNRVDLKGQDPIYAKNFWGQVKQIGDDGRDNNASYLVSGRMRKQVISSTKAGGVYSGPMIECSHVMAIPRGSIMKEIDKSVSDTQATGLENGGHALKGENRVYRWDEGTAAKETRGKDGKITGAKASMKSFTINGENVRPKDASVISLWWHVHPDTIVGGVSLGSSIPSAADKRVQQSLNDNGYSGNSFVIGTRDKRVTFFNGEKELMSIKYDDFLKMGGLDAK